MADICEAIRREEDLPVVFAPEALDAAQQAAPTGEYADLLDIPFVTLDPPGSMDLDQAMAFEALEGGAIRVRYAIADVPAFVAPGSPLDEAARTRGTTVYCPDRRVPLHPVSLSEGRASLLPDEERVAVVFEVDVDAAGAVLRADVRRARIRSRQRFDYATVQAGFDTGAPPEPIELLEDFGRVRIDRGIERGAITLRIPDQEAVLAGGRWELKTRGELAVERWNAEVSLLTGMVAAEMMMDAGVGILRTLPAAPPENVAQLRGKARALGIDWSRDDTASEILAGLDPSHPNSLALFEEASRLLRGAGYLGFVDGVPEGDIAHAGVAAHYAHVTAPLRRLVDRFSLTVCLAVAAGSAVPEWALAGLLDVPGIMSETTNRASRVENRCIDAVEAWVLADRIGEVFDAVVVSANRTGAEVWIEAPPVMASVDGITAEPGSVVRVEVVAADPFRGEMRLEMAA